MNRPHPGLVIKLKGLSSVHKSEVRLNRGYRIVIIMGRFQRSDNSLILFIRSKKKLPL